MKKILRALNSKYIDYLVKGIYAGTMIGIGGTVFLAVENKVVGAFLFAIGLLTICMYGMNLYTGKIGYALINKINYVWELLLTLIGNFIGTFFVGYLVSLTRNTAYVTKAISMVNTKLSDNLWSILILSFFCGILMYIAVNNYKKITGDFGKYSGIILCVMVFILCGFEHCVANMFYISIAHMWTCKSLLYMIVMILGNSLGSFFIALFYNKYYKN